MRTRPVGSKRVHICTTDYTLEPKMTRECAVHSAQKGYENISSISDILRVHRRIYSQFLSRLTTIHTRTNASFCLMQEYDCMAFKRFPMREFFCLQWQKRNKASQRKIAFKYVKGLHIPQNTCKQQIRRCGVGNCCL